MPRRFFSFTESPFDTNLKRIKGELELGRAIGTMYVAAQHLNQTASSAACDAMEDATLMMKIGFNQILQQSPYPTRAMHGLEDSQFFSAGRVLDGEYKRIETDAH